MARYIDADKLIKDIESKRLVFKDTTTIGEALLSQGNAIREAIEKSPTADVVEVVRCGKCKHYVFGKSYTPYCNNVMNLFEEIKPTDFCSYGERRDT